MSGDNSDSRSPFRRHIRMTPRKPETSSELDATDEGRLQFAPGWEEEFYRYKRSLKIPPKLISIGRPSWHRKSTSLPDLDPQHSSDASDTFSEMNKRFTSSASTSTTAKSEPNHSVEPADQKSTSSTTCDGTTTDSQSKSIIDLLHQRVIRAPTVCVKIKKQRNPLQSEPKVVPPSNEVGLFPTPGSEGKALKSENVFDSAVLTSRTRKEYKAMKRQEIIREVFGCEDRPASAPPLNVIEQATQKPAPMPATQADHMSDTKTLTFDQQYEQYLEKMNVDYSEQIRKAKKQAKSEIVVEQTCLLVPKIEQMDDDSSINQDDESQDTELNECARTMDDMKEEACDSNDRGDTPSVMSDRASPTSFSGVLKAKKGRGNRYGRRKGSSGKHPFNIRLSVSCFEA